jgi:hypothetical protein
MNCINCDKSLPDNDKLYYCPFCLTKIKCKSCDQLLIKNAIGCLACGTSIQDTNQKTTELNQIEFEQKGDLKKFRATFTDNVGHELVATFGNMVGVQLPKKKLITTVNTKQNALSTSIEDIQEAEIIEEDDEITEALTQIFKVDGENLVFQIANYKEKNKLEKEIRMSLLILLGYKHLHNSNEIKRKTLNEILKKSKLNTGNFRRWISKSEEIVQLKGGIITLTPKGNTNAIGVLNEIINPNISEGLISFRKPATNRKSKNTSGEIASSGGKSAKSYLLKLLEEGFFSQKRLLSDIIEHLKNDHAVTFATSDISGHMGKFVNMKTLKREKGEKGYEYFL